jgi:hypothetical protein
MDIRDTGCESGNWLDGAHACVHWRGFIFVQLKVCVVLPVSESVLLF